MTNREFVAAFDAHARDNKPLRMRNKKDGTLLDFEYVTDLFISTWPLDGGGNADEFYGVNFCKGTVCVVPDEWELVPDAPKERTGESMTEEEYRKEKPIHDNGIHAALKHLAIQEADFATARYGYYHSPHEGLALIDEEVYEANHAQTLLGNHMHWLRNTVFNDLGEKQMDAIKEIRNHALHLAQEAIHVAATAQRFAEAYETGEGEWAELSR